MSSIRSADDRDGQPKENSGRRRLVFYGALAVAMTVAGATLAVLGAGSGGQTVPAAQPPDNPGDTAPSRPTTTTEAEPVPTVEQATIKGFGTACSSDDLCLEISQPYRYKACDGNGNCREVEYSWEQLKADLIDEGRPEFAVPGEREVAQMATRFRGENLSDGGELITACTAGSDPLSYSYGYAAESLDGGVAFDGFLPLGTPPLELPGVTIYQFEVESPAFGGRQIFATEPTDVTFAEFGEMVSDFGLTDAEVEARTGRPYRQPKNCAEVPR